MNSILSKILTVAVATSVVFGIGGLLALTQRGTAPLEGIGEPSLKISPRTLNLGSNGNSVLFTVEGLGPTPDVFELVGLDLGWDLLGPSAPMASFEDVGLCDGGLDENTSICIQDGNETEDETKFKVNRELVQQLAEQACEMGGCHDLDEGRKDLVNVTFWGEIEPGRFFEVGDMLEVVPQCAPCKVTVTLVSVKYTGDDIGDDWRFMTETHTSANHNKTAWVPGKKDTMDIDNGDTADINAEIFSGVVGKKGDRIYVMVVLNAFEIDPISDDKSVTFIETARGICPFEQTLTDTIEIFDSDIFGVYEAELEVTVKVVADP
jgi:hypothetical protein